MFWKDSAVICYSGNDFSEHQEKFLLKKKSGFIKCLYSKDRRSFFLALKEKEEKRTRYWLLTAKHEIHFSSALIDFAENDKLLLFHSTLMIVTSYVEVNGKAGNRYLNTPRKYWLRELIWKLIRWLLLERWKKERKNILFKRR